MRIIVCLWAILAGLQTTALLPAVPLDPVSAIVDAFRTHSIVAVMAGHGEVRGYALAQLLIHDPRLIAAINDIVIEEGSSRYQDVADRFVRGDNVPMESLRHVWRDTTQPGLGHDRQWQEFFQVIRGLNAAQPAHQIRVLLGDPPIEWENVKTQAEHRRWIEMRETFPADLIQREVLAKGRHALLTYGQMHFQRKNLNANYESQGAAETIVSRLEEKWRAKVFTIFTVADVSALQPDAAQWPTPSVAIVRGTVLGAADFTLYYPSDTIGRFRIREGQVDFSSQIPRDEWKTLRAEDQFDAVLYMGQEESPRVELDPARCRERGEFQEHLRRMAVSGVPPAATEPLKNLCGL